MAGLPSATWTVTAGLASPRNNGKFPPLPKTFRVGEARSLVQPGQMRRRPARACSTDRPARGCVPSAERNSSWRRAVVDGDVLDVGEHAARAQAVEHLAVERRAGARARGGGSRSSRRRRRTRRGRRAAARRGRAADLHVGPAGEARPGPVEHLVLEVERRRRPRPGARRAPARARSRRRSRGRARARRAPAGSRAAPRTPRCGAGSGRAFSQVRRSRARRCATG